MGVAAAGCATGRTSIVSLLLLTLKSGTVAKSTSSRTAIAGSCVYWCRGRTIVSSEAAERHPTGARSVHREMPQSKRRAARHSHMGEGKRYNGPSGVGRPARIGCSAHGEAPPAMKQLLILMWILWANMLWVFGVP